MSRNTRRVLEQQKLAKTKGFYRRSHLATDDSQRVRKVLKHLKIVCMVIPEAHATHTEDYSMLARGHSYAYSLNCPIYATEKNDCRFNIC